MANVAMLNIIMFACCRGRGYEAHHFVHFRQQQLFDQPCNLEQVRKISFYPTFSHSVPVTQKKERLFSGCNKEAQSLHDTPSFAEAVLEASVVAFIVWNRFRQIMVVAQQQFTWTLKPTPPLAMLVLYFHLVNISSTPLLCCFPLEVSSELFCLLRNLVKTRERISLIRTTGNITLCKQSGSRILFFLQYTVYFVHYA